MFNQVRGYGNLRDLEDQFSNLTRLGRPLEYIPNAPKDIIPIIEGMKKGGKVKKQKQKQRQRQVAPLKQRQRQVAPLKPGTQSSGVSNIKINIDNSTKPRNRTRSKISSKTVKEVAPSVPVTKPQYVTNVMGGQIPTQPYNFVELNRRLAGMDERINAPKILGSNVLGQTLPLQVAVQVQPQPEPQPVQPQLDDMKHEVMEPGAIDVVARPKIKLVNGKPLYDTGVDFTYTRNNKQQIPSQYTKRVYITSKNKIKIENTMDTLKSISQVLNDDEYLLLVKHLEDNGISGYPQLDEIKV